MKKTICCIVLMAALILSGPALVSAQESVDENTQKKPTANIMIPDPLFTFDNVVDGTEVVHDFRVYNRGQGELAISKVQTG